MSDASPPSAGVARHGASVPRGLQTAAGVTGRGRFGRMFGDLPRRRLSDAAIEAILDLLDTSGSSDGVIPAGFTYLGQFIDHDLTFDPTSQLEKVNDPFALANFRTPRLDLDSLYGSGPIDEPYLYEWCDPKHRGVKLIVGGGVAEAGHAPPADRDLQRNGEGRALIGDPRNDENLIVSQLHLLFVDFHNAVVEHIREPRRLAGPALLAEAQRIVRWHFQWIVTHDFLHRVVGAPTATAALAAAETSARRLYRSDADPYIPVEFSAAAYRFGHSMVRSNYALNPCTADSKVQVPIFSEAAEPDELGHLGGFRRLPAGLEIDWRFFFELSTEVPPQKSEGIDSKLAIGLQHLPGGVGAEPKLARLNLQRARALELPNGLDVARAMGADELTPHDLRFDVAPAAVKQELLRAPPLWYYVLREARVLHGGTQLGPVGGRIVAEVLTGLIEADPDSYLRRSPGWKPELPPHDGEFTMADLVRFTRPEYMPRLSAGAQRT